MRHSPVGTFHILTVLEGWLSCVSIRTTKMQITIIIAIIGIKSRKTKQKTVIGEEKKLKRSARHGEQTYNHRQIIHQYENHKINVRIGTRCQEMTRESIDIQVPNSPLVASIGSKTFTVFAPPHTGCLIFAGSKEQVSIIVVLDHCNGSFMTLK